MSKIRFKFYSVADWSGIDKLSEYIAICEDFPAIRPDEAGLHKFRKFSKANFDFMTQCWTNDRFPGLSLIKNKPYGVYIDLYISTLMRHVGGSIDDRYLTDDITSADTVINLMRSIIHWGRPVYGYCYHEKEYRKRNVVLFDHSDSFPQCFPGIYWLNYFDAKFVDFFGNDTFHRCNAYRKEEIDGGLLLQTALTPFDYRMAATTKAIREIRHCLGETSFYDKWHTKKEYKMPVFTQELYQKIVNERTSLSIPYGLLGEISEFMANAATIAESYAAQHDITLTYQSLDAIERLIMCQQRESFQNDQASKELLVQLTAIYGEILRRALKGKWVSKKNYAGQNYPAISFTYAGVRTEENPFLAIVDLWGESEPAEGQRLTERAPEIKRKGRARE